MITEDECIAAACSCFGAALGKEKALEVLSRIVATWHKEEGKLIANFGIFDEIIEEGVNDYADKLMTVSVDMKTGESEIIYQSEEI